MCEISIIMPAYNAAKTLERAIQSVIEQTYESWQLIIIDDGSNDDTKKIARKFQNMDGRIRIIELAENQGIAQARNHGIAVAEGAYTAFLDSDDYWKKEKLAKQIQFMKQGEIAFSFCNYQVVSAEGTFVRQIEVPLKQIDYQTLLKTNWIGCLTVCVKTDLLKKYPFEIIKHEDYALWLRLLEKECDYAYLLEDSLAYYQSSTTSTSSNKWKSLLWVWTIFRKSQKFSLLKTTSYFIRYCMCTLNKKA